MDTLIPITLLTTVCGLCWLIVVTQATKGLHPVLRAVMIIGVTLMIGGLYLYGVSLIR